MSEGLPVIVDAHFTDLLISQRRIDLALEGEQLVEKLHQAAIF